MQKEEQLIEKRFLELSRLAYQREIITYTDFLNLNELDILHTLPKADIYARYVTFGGYTEAERRMAAFIPDALYLREESPVHPFTVLRITPLHEKYAQALTHRDYLGAILNLGINRSKMGDILIMEDKAYFFAHSSLSEFLTEELIKIRHTTVLTQEVDLATFSFTPQYQEIKGTVASVRLDSLLSLAFSTSRNRLTGLIEGGKVFVNGRLITSNGYKVKEEDIISVRGLGKFQYKGVITATKKNRLMVSIYKYI